jgi:lysophospholipase L1-like esterase
LERRAQMSGIGSGARLAAVFDRLRRGEDIVVVAVGGSITTGYAAPLPAAEGWFGRMGTWWREKAAESGARVELRNRGVSGTDSLWANFRITDHARGADLVFLEFAMNDQWLDPAIRRPTYEACIRRLSSMDTPPAIIALFLCEKADPAKGQAREQKALSEYYGLPSVDFGAWQEARSRSGGQGWDALFDGAETIHPNAAGHRAISDCLIEFLEAASRGAGNGSLASVTPEVSSMRRALLPEPLYSSDFAFTELWDSRNARSIRSAGWTAGGDRHGEWVAGGCPDGWRCATEGATLELAVHGRMVGVLFSESDADRDLEAWVDDLPHETLRCFVDFRKGYLGWSSRILARALNEGEHVLHVRLKDDGPEGRSACLVAAFGAGAVPESMLAPPEPPLRYQPLSVRDPLLRYTGRFARVAAGEPLTFGWQGSSLECEFEGRGIAFGLECVWGRNWLNAEVDGLTRIIELPEGKSLRWESGDLGRGRHRVKLFKRSEGVFGALLARSAELEGRLVELPPRPRLRIEFYGDSITAGACDLDAELDQYDSLAPHDNAQAYPAVASRELGAEYVGIAVSGTGITCSWNPIILSEVLDLDRPVLGAPRGDFSPGAPGGGEPDIVVINLGQNDVGFPASQGRPLSPEFGSGYVDFVRKARLLHPGSWIVCAIGGMSAWRDSAELRQAFGRAVGELKAGDGRISDFAFTAFTENHPRVDTHALLARELTEYLRSEVLPRIGKRRTVDD